MIKSLNEYLIVIIYKDIKRSQTKMTLCNLPTRICPYDEHNKVEHTNKLIQKYGEISIIQRVPVVVLTVARDKYQDIPLSILFTSMYFLQG